MTGEQRKQIRFLLEREFGREDRKIDKILDELENYIPTYTSADPYGADRKARELPPRRYNLIGGISENFHPEDH